MRSFLSREQNVFALHSFRCWTANPIPLEPKGENTVKKNPSSHTISCLYFFWIFKKQRRKKRKKYPIGKDRTEFQVRVLGRSFPFLSFWHLVILTAADLPFKKNLTLKRALYLLCLELLQLWFVFFESCFRGCCHPMPTPHHSSSSHRFFIHWLPVLVAL